MYGQPRQLAASVMGCVWSTKAAGCFGGGGQGAYAGLGAGQIVGTAIYLAGVKATCLLARALHRDPPAGGSRNWPTLICLMRFRNSRAENWVGA